jgi:hypothetical protein
LLTTCQKIRKKVRKAKKEDMAIMDIEEDGDSPVTDKSGEKKEL